MGKDEAAKGYGNVEEGAPGDSGRSERAIAIGGRRVRVAAIVLAALLLLLVVGAVGVYAYDSAHRDQIADGVKVGSVDLGGLDRDQAIRRLQRRLVAPLLHRPVKVQFVDQSYKLSPRRAGLHADLDAMVDDAIDASQSWGLPARVVRYVTGAEINDTVKPAVSYSPKAVHRFVKHVTKSINRPPQDATVSPTGSSLNVVPAANGRTVKAHKLERQVKDALDRPPPHRLVTAHVVLHKPKVSTKEVASKYPDFLTLDRAGFTLRFWDHLKLVRSYTVAVGQAGLETPEGLYHIESKEVDPTWHVPESSWAGSLAGQDIPPGPSNPLKARWMGIFAGAGIHGTDETWSIGQAVSHGCVRMTIPDVIDLYDRVAVGTPIYIG